MKTSFLIDSMYYYTKDSAFYKTCTFSLLTTNVNTNDKLLCNSSLDIK